MKARQLWLPSILVSVMASVIGVSALSSPRAPIQSLARADAWLNSPPLSGTDPRGKVVLVDFWTYTCINWRRTLPWLQAWHQKYKDHGLVIIGVHTPEFSFEKDIDNIRREAQRQNVIYPIAVDSGYAIWSAFDNHYWPAVYFVDANGRIQHRQFGEGDYEKLEAIIQRLLTEAGHSGFDRAVVFAQGSGAELAADWDNLATPETYVGFGHAERLSSPQRSTELRLNEWALLGDWRMKREFASLDKAGGKIRYRFHARDVHLVMGPCAGGPAVRFRVTLDGHPPGAAHGVDVDAEGRGVVDAPRM